MNRFGLLLNSSGVAIALLFYFLPSVLLAGSRLNFPTVWKIENRTKKSVWIYCTSHAEGLNYPIEFSPKKPISPGVQEEYKWSSFYFNDNKGLNPGHWNCHCGYAQITPENQRNGHAEFDTDWGENIKLGVTEREGHLEFYRE